ncbi:beta-glucan synthesis-associated [Dentipellis sp. KUC8613]|nr:beta-glucan synthesis-associated [Dentipellis sp. KUC8613]
MLPPHPSAWGADVRPHVPEPDDWLHTPDPRRDKHVDRGGSICTPRGAANLGCLLVLAGGIVALFGGYPIISFFRRHVMSTNGGFGVGGTNETGQIPSMHGNWGMIDADTPSWAHQKASWMDPSTQLQLVFSDEFNTPGRTFYPGDDPYWEAVDLHYWQTGNMEWYDPAAVTTRGGALEIALSRKQTHGLDYQGGMIQSWNKFCFTGGVLEVALQLPGDNNVAGLWPAVWTMGNLGRAGFGASLEGMWPYSYDSCDVGTVANQTINGQPAAATVGGDPYNDGILSFQPGQRLSRCTCDGEAHPGPKHTDGTYVGRSAPEIDLFEASVGDGVGHLSLSGQFAPFNAEYYWDNSTSTHQVYQPDTTQNGYSGGVFQEAVSFVTRSDQRCYQLLEDCMNVYGLEYVPGFDDAYMTWIANNQTAWTLYASGVGADERVNIGPRAIPQEPMYIIMNLGMSTAFGIVDTDNLTFPSIMRVDYVRVYQHPDNINVGCNPKDFPTTDYINQYMEAYTNPNLTTWQNDFKQPFPRNNLTNGC